MSAAEEHRVARLDRQLAIACWFSLLVAWGVVMARQGQILSAIEAHDAQSRAAVQAIEEWQRAHAEHTDAEITRQVKPEALK